MRNFKFIIITFFSSYLSGQTKNPLIIGTNMGAGTIKGELTNFGFAPHVGVFAQKDFGKYLQLGFEFNKLQFLGSKLNVGPSQNVFGNGGAKNNFQLSSNANQLGFHAAFNISPSTLRKKNINIYLSTGFGVMDIQSKCTFLDLRDTLYCEFCSHSIPQPNPRYQQSVVETYEGRHWYVPAGVNANYILKNQYLLGLQFQAMYMRSDDIDLINYTIKYNKRWDIPMSIFLKFGYLLNCTSH